MTHPDLRMPDGFGRDAAGRLLVAGRPAEDWVAETGGTPLFLYDPAIVAAHVCRLRRALPAGVAVHYAIKANPFPPLLARMAALVDGFDVASGGELARALAAGLSPERISFAGPGKRDSDLEAAIQAGITLVVESAGEATRALAHAHRLGRRLRALLRVNPPFELRGSGLRMGGGARPFGVDADQAPGVLARLKDPAVDFLGFHVFAGAQNLDWAAIAEAQRATVALVAELAAHAPGPVRLVNLGGGFGVPYFPGDRPLDVEALGAALARTLADRPPPLRQSAFALELGRWLVAEAGVYLARILDRKTSGGELFLVTDGGLHHVLAGTGNFGTVVRRNWPLVNASRAGPPFETATVTGCLCTPLDRLAERLTIATGREGDLVALFLAGAYGRTASPEAFLGHPPPGERLAA
ncbi:MAG: pyridoxal-dependent decarboxylase, exosortase A system-associated [Sphingomonadaceae bacterium]|uniref:pyridoxal-dependent decarboxylase, exosortase A system-associated n=1 Tax=Thermaurantiacus sp. TaxID=2820283 RepID=UPI00298EE3D1|nr:pyridoxal-dependent decarboxylase, exosortase A system-associated [Thermaurantiacus sp.]MCS6986461.1 pyridoxal-dependent decarboxylase, exosortase A system-associated [Sphingomonadaceae bacterium]MDW8414278.1 pyridoxal-dependent decarboxylase, exosortase A system-associated [Thermaurantiacus sp.]